MLAVDTSNIAKLDHLPQYITIPDIHEGRHRHEKPLIDGVVLSGRRITFYYMFKIRPAQYFRIGAW